MSVYKNSELFVMWFCFVEYCGFFDIINDIIFFNYLFDFEFIIFFFLYVWVIDLFKFIFIFKYEFVSILYKVFFSKYDIFNI